MVAEKCNQLPGSAWLAMMLEHVGAAWPHLCEAAAGGLASAGATFASNPIDVVKVRMQLQGELRLSSSSLYSGSLMHSLRLVALEGSLLRGLLPAVLFNTLMNCVRFGGYSLGHASLVDAQASWGRHRTGRVRSGWVKSGQVGSGRVRSDQCEARWGMARHSGVERGGAGWGGAGRDRGLTPPYLTPTALVPLQASWAGHALAHVALGCGVGALGAAVASPFAIVRTQLHVAAPQPLAVGYQHWVSGMVQALFRLAGHSGGATPPLGEQMRRVYAGAVPQAWRVGTATSVQV